MLCLCFTASASTPLDLQNGKGEGDEEGKRGMSEGDGEKEGSLPSSALEPPPAACRPSRRVGGCPSRCPEPPPGRGPRKHGRAPCAGRRGHGLRRGAWAGSRRGFPNHLLGAVRIDAGELRALAAEGAASVAARGRVPVVAGGSNSLEWSGGEGRAGSGGEGMERL